MRNDKLVFFGRKIKYVVSIENNKSRTRTSKRNELRTLVSGIICRKALKKFHIRILFHFRSF